MPRAISEDRHSQRARARAHSAQIPEGHTLLFRGPAPRGEDVLSLHNATGQAKLEHYVASLHMLEQITATHPLVRQLRFELEVLHALPPRPDLLDASS